jgi:hypothetical protein
LHNRASEAIQFKIQISTYIATLVQFTTTTAMDTHFEDQMFTEFSTDPIIHHSLNPPHHHHHHHHHPQTIMIRDTNGNINQQHQRLPDVHQILPGNSPKMDHYKTTTTSTLDYSHVKMESPYSPNGKIEYINGTSGIAKLESYSPSSGVHKLEYVTSNGGQYSPNSKIIEYTTVPTASQQQQHNIEHIQIFQQPQSLDGNQQNIINGTDGNFKRKSDENLNNGSPTPTTINSVSPSDGTSSTSPHKKPVDKKKNDQNGVKKKKTR